MGAARRQKAKRLAEKLLKIRLALDVSQDGMMVRLGLADEHVRSRISAYERGTREPALPVLLRYARCVGISTDVLIDDELELPAKLLKDAERGRSWGKSASRSKRKR
jgi:transcriptional regulator with XRE-family HTH domain